MISVCRHRSLLSIASVLGAFVAGTGLVASLGAQNTKPAPAPINNDEIAKAMVAAQKFTVPSTHHKELERFVGKWTTKSRIFMGGTATPPESGTAEFRWLMDGRWLICDTDGSMMGMKMKGFVLLGYDNFKMSYVQTSVTDFDTAMNRMEGDMDPSGKSLLLYGTLDEYLTGEHDKMVKYVYRFDSADRITLEVHDLPIGEHNTKVVEWIFERVK
ncbi:MAG: DUF1579 family protein [Phycisphaerae bacterium]|nr:DUF1579 family protein [Phycisphaerae bacterium]